MKSTKTQRKRTVAFAQVLRGVCPQNLDSLIDGLLLKGVVRQFPRILCSLGFMLSKKKNKVKKILEA